MTAYVKVSRLTSIKGAGAYTVAYAHVAGPTLARTLAGASGGTVIGNIQQFNDARNTHAALLKGDYPAVDVTGKRHARGTFEKSLMVDAPDASDIGFLGKPTLTQRASNAATVNAK